MNGSDHWRKKAEESRTLADNTADPTAKQTLIDIAQAWERMVERAEAQEAKLKDKDHG